MNPLCTKKLNKTLDSASSTGIRKLIMKCPRCSQWSLSKRLKDLTSDREECRSIRQSLKTKFTTDQRSTMMSSCKSLSDHKESFF